MYTLSYYKHEKYRKVTSDHHQLLHISEDFFRFKKKILFRPKVYGEKRILKLNHREGRRLGVL